jgi:ABC-type lipoprotein release transport system permease subunit
MPTAAKAGLQPSAPATFVAMSVALLLIGLLARYLPAPRAWGVDPIESLQGE